jgi:hypothetical protein
MLPFVPMSFSFPLHLNKCSYPNTRAREEAVAEEVAEEVAEALEVVAPCLPEARAIAVTAAAEIAG